MTKLGYDWEYVDVAEYVKMKQEQGKCKTLVVKERVGAETKLFDTALKISFRCDGIIKQISTGEYFLFEFKNVASFKFNTLEDKILDQHHNQVVCYCTALDLEKAFVTYEDRNMCELKVPELFIVTPEMKQELTDRIFECEGYVERLIPPPKEESSHNCRWCKYKSLCKKAGD
jgi:CRISPR/Cas system-associated exonuclease Cas4 (RecB family)